MPKAFSLFVVVTVAAISACGGGEGTKPKEPSPPPAASTAAPAPVVTNMPAPPSASGEAVSPPPPALANRPLTASAMEMQLREIGVDPNALPPLNKLDAQALRGVMNTFTKSLGVRCNHCHDKDFKAPTPNKAIATRMWNDFTRSLTIRAGGALYCDSCHGGHATFLDRRDPASLGRWMQSNYVDPLARADGNEHGCDTCHGHPFEGKILTKLWR
jgi:hypothetical protein